MHTKLLDCADAESEKTKNYENLKKKKFPRVWDFCFSPQIACLLLAALEVCTTPENQENGTFTSENNRFFKEKGKTKKSSYIEVAVAIEKEKKRFFAAQKG